MNLSTHGFQEKKGKDESRKRKLLGKTKRGAFSKEQKRSRRKIGGVKKECLEGDGTGKRAADHIRVPGRAKHRWRGGNFLPVSSGRVQSHWKEFK